MPRFEHVDATTMLAWRTPGAPYGQDRLGVNQYAVQLYADNTIILVTGTPAQLMDWAAQVTDIANRAVRHAEAPLTLDDFIIDDDHDFACPRCTDTFQAAGHDKVAELLEELRQHVDEHARQLARA